VTIERGWEDADDQQEQNATPWFPEAIPVRVVATETETVSPESASWMSYQIAGLAAITGIGGLRPTQICTHKYHRYKAKFLWTIPNNVTVYLANNETALMSNALGFAFSLVSGQVLPDYDSQQPLYAAYSVPATLAAPGIGATGVAVQNPYPYPTAVFIGGGTVTNVQVNGISVGTTTNNTYYVPAYGALTVTYSVAPTLTWNPASQLNPGTGALVQVPFVSVLDESYKTVQ
jgi:hypothetical protein